jgi:16S rRNA G527 N7-methylase RsmG
MLVELELDNIEIELSRLESLLPEPDRIGKFDGFTSRATQRLGPTLLLASEFVLPGGAAYLWKGSRLDQEMSEDDRWLEHWDHGGRLSLASGRAIVARFIRKKS